MKKVIKAVIAIILVFFVLIAGAFTYSTWQNVKKMRYCSFALDGDEDVLFYLEDGRVYKTIPFPEGLERNDIVNTLTSLKHECPATFEQTGYCVYRDPFKDGAEYAVFVPSLSFSELLPSPFSEYASPFAYYAVEIEPGESVN